MIMMKTLCDRGDSLGWGDSDVHIIQVKVNGFDGDYYDDPKNDYDILTWLDQDSGILYSIQMNCDVRQLHFHAL